MQEQIAARHQRRTAEAESSRRKSEEEEGRANLPQAQDRSRGEQGTLEVN